MSARRRLDAHRVRSSSTSTSRLAGLLGTLQFRGGNSSFLLFRHPDRRLRHLGSPFKGLNVHAATPGTYSTPLGSFWATACLCGTPDSQILKVPEWLFDQDFISEDSTDAKTPPQLLR